MIINESKIRKIIREVLNKTLMKEVENTPYAIAQTPEDRLEGLPGEWAYAIVAHTDGYTRLKNRRLNDWIKGSYTVEDWLDIEEELTPEDVRDVRMQVMSGDSNVGDRFLLSDISNIEGESVYQAHPLVQQVIDWFVRDWESHSSELLEDMTDPEMADEIRAWFAEQRQRVGAEVEEVTDEPVETDEEESITDEEESILTYEGVSLDNAAVLFVGDSQTRQYGGSNNYVDQIASRYPNMTIENLAKDGSRLKAIQKQLKSGIVNGPKGYNDKYSGDTWDVITIMGGGNHWGDTNPPKSRYDQLYKLAESNGAVVVAITNPTKEHLLAKKPGKKRSVATNESMAEYVRTNALSKGADILIDANSNLRESSHFDKARSDGSTRNDAVHLGDTGHTWIANQWINKVGTKLDNNDMVG